MSELCRMLHPGVKIYRQFGPVACSILPKPGKLFITRRKILPQFDSRAGQKNPRLRGRGVEGMQIAGNPPG